MQSLVLARLDRDTRQRHASADNDRLVLMSTTVTPELYRAFLVRVFGFEAAVETMLHMTTGLDDVVDLRSRVHVRLLKSDLAALALTSVAHVPRCRSVIPFACHADALGWMYVVERNMLLHGVLRRHLESRLPEQLATAGAYLAGNERNAGARLRELGEALDAIARPPVMADRVVAAAHAAFRSQRHWFADAAAPRARVA